MSLFYFIFTKKKSFKKWFGSGWLSKNTGRVTGQPVFASGQKIGFGSSIFWVGLGRIRQFWPVLPYLVATPISNSYGCSVRPRRSCMHVLNKYIYIYIYIYSFFFFFYSRQFLPFYLLQSQGAHVYTSQWATIFSFLQLPIMHINILYKKNIKTKNFYYIKNSVMSTIFSQQFHNKNLVISC